MSHYVETFTACSTLTPRDVAEASALWLVSAAVGRRVVARLAEDAVYPTLWFFVLAPSAVFAKSVTKRRILDLLNWSGAVGALPDSFMPEALLNALAENPHRAWVVEEASKILKASNREYMATLKEDLMALYDAPDSLSRLTKGEGKVTASHPSLHVFAVSTPAYCKPFLLKPEEWTGGFWSRFVLLLADQPKEHYERPRVSYEALKPFAERLAAVAKKLDSVGASAAEPVSAQITPEALDAHYGWFGELYEAVVRRYKQGIADQHNATLIRSANRAMRVALLAAVSDWAEQGEGRAPIVTLEHYTFGRALAERWLEHAERVLVVGEQDNGDPLAERVLGMLDRNGGRVKQNLLLTNLKVDVRRLNDTIADLVARELVTTYEERNANGTVTRWIVRREPENEVPIDAVFDV